LEESSQPNPVSKAKPGGGVFLSIIIPAHNEERRLPGTLEKVLAFLASQPYAAEVLVVENGSADRTAEVAESFAARRHNVRVLREVRRGKGLAVRRGMLEARGEFRFLCDADLSMPIEQVNRFLPPALDGVDVAVGSREAPGSEVIDSPMRRKIGRTFNLFVRMLGLTSLRDTQCGFKCFRAAVAEDVFTRQRLEGMAFDAEVLYVARRRGYRIAEVPITWRIDADSRVRLFQDSLNMGKDLLVIRWNGWRGFYDGQERDRST
jgi:glycosyltransferase involved in cell wall biosynthesis